TTSECGSLWWELFSRPTMTKSSDASAGDAERAQLLKRLAELENASQALDPGANRRKKLRTAVFASAERFLRKLHASKAYEETAGKGAGLLEAPISERGISIEAAIDLFDREV